MAILTVKILSRNAFWSMHFTETRVKKCCIARKGDPEKVGDFHVFIYSKFSCTTVHNENYNE